MSIISCNVHQKVQTLTLIVSFRVFYILREKITLKYMKMSSPASYPYIQHRKWMVKRVCVASFSSSVSIPYKIGNTHKKGNLTLKRLRMKWLKEQSAVYCWNSEYTVEVKLYYIIKNVDDKISKFMNKFWTVWKQKIRIDLK